MIQQATNSQSPGLLVVKDVYAAYVKKEILRGVSLSVKHGEIVALLGGNGSGKSTLLKTIAGLLHPTKGQVDFKGQDITGLSVHDRQKYGIGYLLQGGRVFPNLTAGENFEIAIKHHRKNHKHTRPVLGSIFPILQKKMDIRAGLFSGGERQMLAIEMVLAQAPELVLLDEPTGALSRDLAREILDHVGKTVRQSGCGVLFVEQNVEAARKVCDRQVTLDEGRLVSA